MSRLALTLALSGFAAAVPAASAQIDAGPPVWLEVGEPREPILPVAESAVIPATLHYRCRALVPSALPLAVRADFWAEPGEPWAYPQVAPASALLSTHPLDCPPHEVRAQALALAVELDRGAPAFATSRIEVVAVVHSTVEQFTARGQTDVQAAFRHHLYTAIEPATLEIDPGARANVTLRLANLGNGPVGLTFDLEPLGPLPADANITVEAPGWTPLLPVDHPTLFVPVQIALAAGAEVPAVDRSVVYRLVITSRATGDQADWESVPVEFAVLLRGDEPLVDLDGEELAALPVPGPLSAAGALLLAALAARRRR